jgi:hypothetical protein
MAEINVYFGREAEKKRFTLELKARKSLDGNILIFDHNEMDIVIMPAGKKIVTFAKDDFSETVYEVQDRFFTYLKRKGIISYDSIKGGNVYGSIEGLLEESKDEYVNTIDYALFNISKFLKEEQPYYDYIEDYEKMLDDYYTEPTDSDSTELGEVPQAAEKGNIMPGFNYEPYWMSYMLEEKKKD